jgi:UDP-N-acetylmuramoyl-tripeptide--D-alanyl-D-alanine ligase
MRESYREILAILRHAPCWLLAFVWRTLLFRTIFIAVTGSLGKTAAKDLLGAMLATAGPTVKTPGNRNARVGIPRTILMVRPWHRFAVLETGTDRPGGLVRASLLVRPNVVLILKVDRTHNSAFKTLDRTALEKRQILRFMRRTGVAVLNADDDRVAAMADYAPAQVVWFGDKEGLHVSVEKAESRWPETLRVKLRVGDKSVEAPTRLVGVHWRHSLAGALAAAIACGVPPQQAAAAASAVEPYPGRMQPAGLPGGALVLRDDFNGSIASLGAALEVLRHARARRRILVISDCADFRRRPRERMKYYARVSKESADAVVFVGERAGCGVESARKLGMSEDEAHGFVRWQDAAQFLRSHLGAGDLVLLRGQGLHHLARLYFAMTGTVGCHKAHCSRTEICDHCPELLFRLSSGEENAGPCAE